jgi:hypothetical protein
MSSYKLNMISKKYWLILPVFIAVTFWTVSTKAFAEPRAVDVFSVNSRNTPGSTPIILWFEKYDRLRQQYRPSEIDKVILTRPLMQNPQRVQQFTNTASKISKTYSLLAKSIRNMTVPSGMSDVKEYRDLMADWYQDSAAIYNDLIRPRPPAKTIEDLQEELDAIKKRSEGLANNMGNLKAMDRQVREAHKVPMPLEGDAVQQFIRSN